MFFVFKAFLYVANDVIQHDKRKGGDFVKDFLPMLASAVQHIVSRIDDENIHKTVKRIIQIWSERQIYQPDAIKLLKTSLENGVWRLRESFEVFHSKQKFSCYVFHTRSDRSGKGGSNIYRWANGFVKFSIGTPFLKSIS